MNNDHIANFIKEIRKKNNQTQKEFANKYNVSFQAVSKWENGKNMPDIYLLKQICKDNNISIDKILNDNKDGDNNDKKNNKYKKLLIIVFIFIIIYLSIVIFNTNNKSDFEFKKISTNCSTFEITGSAAYNKNKSSIYISNIEFCGENENVKYKEVEYTLFESYEGTNVKISSGNKEKDITLVDYLKKLKINVNNYTQICKSFSHSNLYIEIDAIDVTNKNITYKIPIVLEENC